MKKFNSLNELNDYVNSNPIDINDIDIDSLTVKITSKMTTFGVMSTENEYPCYIIFNDKSSYREYKEGKQIDADLHSINAIQINITLSEFKRLKPNVRFIEFIDINEKATPTEANSEIPKFLKTNWGADIANVQESWAKGYTGKGVKVAVIDGMFHSSPNFLNFKEHIIMGAGSLDYENHGNQCASIICSPMTNQMVGIAHGCDLYALETDLKTTTLALCYQWCIDNEMDIASASYGMDAFDAGHGTTNKLIIQAMIASGVLFVAAAGNKNAYQWHPPASIEGVVSVGAVAEWGKLQKVTWDSSNSEGGGMNQPWVDFIFAGEDVASIGKINRWSYFGGTSAACPAIAGMFALLKEEFPNKTNVELIALLKSNSFQVLGRYGVFPIYTDYENSQVEENRILKVNKDGSINIKGELIIDEDCEKVRIDKYGNMHLKSYFTGITYRRNSYPISFKKNTVSARCIIENSDI